MASEPRKFYPRIKRNNPTWNEATQAWDSVEVQTWENLPDPVYTPRTKPT